jgi:Ca-activated chloride channel homolog
VRFASIALLVLCPLLLVAQEGGDAPATFRTESSLVVLNASVLGSDGRPVNGLPRSAFTVYDNGVVQQLSVFRQEDVPLSLGLVIDASASMAAKRERVAAAALALVTLSNPEDEVCLLQFNQEATLVQRFTSDVPLLDAALRALGASGETAMRDALLLGVEQLRFRASRDKKVLVVITDGEDNSSIETQAHLAEAALRSDVLVYGIGLLSGEEPASAARARRALEELTSSTGGRAWFPASTAEVERITPEIAHEIRNQYILGYSPGTSDSKPGFRSLRVVVNSPGVTVRTRAGYYRQ